MEVLSATDLRKSYGDTVALDGVSLSAEAGEVFGLIGPNGAGKTTLVRCLTGTTTPDGGDAELFGDAPTAVDRDRLGLLPQSFDPPGRLTARELVESYAGLYESARDPEAALRDVGLDPDGTRYEDLSGGQRRRACVATAVVNDPDVLFLDEPTTGIDPAGRRDLWALIERLAAGGTTVFLTTHYMAEAERLCDRVGLLAGGRLVADGAPSALVTEYGGVSVLLVETDADPDDLEGTGVAAESVEGGIRLPGVSASDVGDAVRALDEASVSFSSLEWREPDLEDVYLSLAEDGRHTGGLR